MPIYAYKCDSCGFAKDVLQKISDVPLSECPSCHGATFSKQVTAAGFQLKGSGWYVTDFRDGGKSVAPGVDGKASESGGDKADGGKSEGGKSEGGGEAKAPSTSDAKTESPSGSKPASEAPAGKPAPTTPSRTGSAS